MTTPTVVLPGSFQTWRADVRAGVLAMLNLFTASYPAVARVNYHALPMLRVGEGPFVYLSQIVETVSHDADTRLTVFGGSFGYVDDLINPEDTAGRIDVWADFMRDVCTANARMFPFGMFEQTGLHEGEMPEGGPAELTNVLLDWRFTVNEGRS